MFSGLPSTVSGTTSGYRHTDRKIASSGSVAAITSGTPWPGSTSRSAWSICRAYWRIRTFCPSVALQLAHGGAVLDGRLADRARDVARHVRHAHDLGGGVRHRLQQPHPALGEREHERGLWERDRSHQRLDVQPLPRDGPLDQAVGQPERAHPTGSGEYGERARLMPPELVVLLEVGEGVLQRGEVAFVHLGELVKGRADEVLERDPLALAGRRGLGLHVQRDRRRGHRLPQRIDFGTGRDVGVQRHRGSLLGGTVPPSLPRRAARVNLSC